MFIWFFLWFNHLTWKSYCFFDLRVDFEFSLSWKTILILRLNSIIFVSSFLRSSQKEHQIIRSSKTLKMLWFGWNLVYDWIRYIFKFDIEFPTYPFITESSPRSSKKRTFFMIFLFLILVWLNSLYFVFYNEFPTYPHIWWNQVTVVRDERLFLW